MFQIFPKMEAPHHLQATCSNVSLCLTDEADPGGPET